MFSANSSIIHGPVINEPHFRSHQWLMEYTLHMAMGVLDLTFYLEVQKYKELTHSHTDEEIVKKKCQAITDCYFESVIAPPCQVRSCLSSLAYRALATCVYRIRMNLCEDNSGYAVLNEDVSAHSFCYSAILLLMNHIDENILNFYL